MTATRCRCAALARRLVRAAAALALAGCALAGGAVAADAPPAAGVAGARCVEETGYMRRNHMDLLRHHVLMVIMPVFVLVSHLLLRWVLRRYARRHHVLPLPDPEPTP